MTTVFFIAALFCLSVCSADFVQVNVATAKKTWQSSIYAAGGLYQVAGYAVDLDTEHLGDPAKFHCSHTNSDVNAWWVVDLGDVQQVAFVRITPRVETIDRIANAIVGVSNISPDQRGPVINGYPVCGQVSGTPSKNGPITITCAPIPPGRFVVIQLPGQNYLELCEVEVFAYSALAVES